MENVKTVFCSSESSCHNTELQAYVNISAEIFIGINESGSEFASQYICLDKSSAIKLVRHLKKQIGIINDFETSPF